MLRNMRLFTFIAGAVVSATTAVSQSLPEIVEGELLPGWRTESGTHMSALRLTLAPGWKTYWRAPGDAGIPPRFDWQGSENVEAVAISWPVPDVFVQNGMRSVGYENVVTIPLEFRPTDSGSPISAVGAIELGVCEEVCVPMTVLVSAELMPDANDRDSSIAAALADRPMNRVEAGVRNVDCSLAPIDDGMRLTATIDMPALGGREVGIVELTGAGVWVSEPTLTRDGDQLVAVADLVPPDARPFVLERSALRFTVISEGRAVDIRGCG